MAESLQSMLALLPYQFTSDPAAFLQSPTANASQTPWLLVKSPDTRTFPSLAEIPHTLLASVQGISIAATIKLLLESDVGNNGWFLDRLRLPGALRSSTVNSATQQVILALLHGIHAYFVASHESGVPPITAPLPTRFQFVVNSATDTFLNKKNTEAYFTLLKRQFLNQNERDDEVQIRELMRLLRTKPAELLKHPFMRAPTGPFPIQTEQKNVGDTETVKDFYVAAVPSIYDILGM